MCSACRPSRNGSPWTSPARTGSTTRGRPRYGCRTSTSRASKRSGAGSRDVYAEGAAAPGRVRERADDAYLRSLAHAVTGGLGGRVGIAPRVFLKKLVQDVLDRIDLHPDFDPLRDYALTLTDGELTDVERNARAAATPDDVELEP